VFPNLFPLAALHAVVTYPERHFLRPSEFDPALLAEGFAAALEFARHAEAAYGDLEHLELCCNHMLPAGASMVHPHFQVFGGAAAPWLLRRQWECEAAFREREGAPHWAALVDEETARRERFIDTRAGCTWMAAYAPTGGREVVAVLPGRARLTALDDAQVTELSRGLSKVLAWYEREGLSAFNFTLAGSPLSAGPLGGGSLGDDAATHAVVLRVVARTAFKPDYRTDDYFLQKQLGGELFFSPPERLAAALRDEFGAG
jgi:UDPglucose--hexose-1-phosphate uridylyltransferase